jgi:sulfite reductase (ferredoxin)
MIGSIEPILHIPETVREDTLNYRGKVEDFLKGQTSPVGFRGYRVPMGVYEQRAAGKFMVRIRIGAGLVLPVQLKRIAQLSKKYGNGITHVTTRQDIQIHEVNIEDTPDVLEGLLEAGLSPRGGGGNTVRNVTACPRAGICPDEQFDVAPYSIAAAEYLLQDRSSFNLPRKYKIVFSGCSTDCAFASVADLGFFAHIKDGVKGFSVYAAGGLGSNPGVAVKIEDFIEAEDIFVVAEAIKRLFDKHGDRANKNKARLRYVLARVRADEFIKLYEQERDTLKAEGLPYETPQIRDIAYPVAADAVTVRLWLKNGDIPADDLSKLGQIAAKYGQGLVRTTQLQDILITGVAKQDVDKVNSELKELSIDVFGSGPKIVACTGAATCKLGLCLSRGLADAISDKLQKNGDTDEVIRISGCPNSCANHYIASVGFQGRAKRINGRLMPFYDVLVDAKTVEGQARLAERIGTVPAKRVPDMLDEAFSNGIVDKEQLKNLTAKYSDISSESLPEDYYFDYGSDKPFSLAGRGPGECGAGVMDVIKLDIDEAKDALKKTPVDSENVYKAIVASARALLVTVGLEPKKDREIFAVFTEHLIAPGWVKSQTQQLLDDTIDWRMGDRESLEDLLPQIRELAERVEELFLSLDANLKFKVEPIESKTPAEHADEKTHKADLRGVACPLNFVKAKLELEKIEIGDVLEVLLDEGESVRNVPASFAGQGQEVMEVKDIGGHFCVKVRRQK